MGFSTSTCTEFVEVLASKARRRRGARASCSWSVVVWHGLTTLGKSMDEGSLYCW